MELSVALDAEKKHSAELSAALCAEKQQSEQLHQNLRVERHARQRGQLRKDVLKGQIRLLKSVEASSVVTKNASKAIDASGGETCTTKRTVAKRCLERSNQTFE